MSRDPLDELRVLRESELDLMTELTDLDDEIRTRVERVGVVRTLLRETRRRRDALRARLHLREDRSV